MKRTTCRGASRIPGAAASPNPRNGALTIQTLPGNHLPYLPSSYSNFSPHSLCGRKLPILNRNSRGSSHFLVRNKAPPCSRTSVHIKSKLKAANPWENKRHALPLLHVKRLHIITEQIASSIPMLFCRAQVCHSDTAGQCYPLADHLQPHPCVRYNISSTDHHNTSLSPATLHHPAFTALYRPP